MPYVTNIFWLFYCCNSIVLCYHLLCRSLNLLTVSVACQPLISAATGTDSSFPSTLLTTPPACGCLMKVRGSPPDFSSNPLSISWTGDPLGSPFSASTTSSLGLCWSPEPYSYCSHLLRNLYLHVFQSVNSTFSLISSPFWLSKHSGP